MAAYRGTPLHTSAHSYRNSGWEASHQMVNFTHLLRHGKQTSQKLLYARLYESIHNADIQVTPEGYIIKSFSGRMAALLFKSSR